LSNSVRLSHFVFDGEEGGVEGEGEDDDWHGGKGVDPKVPQQHLFRFEIGEEAGECDD